MLKQKIKQKRLDKELVNFPVSGFYRKQAAVFLYNLGLLVKILKSTYYFIFQGKASHRIFISQVFFTCAEALRISFLLAFSTGFAIVILGTPFLTGFSQEMLIYPLLITILVRELGPLLIAFIVIAHSAAAIATELAGNVISRETEAYISIGLDPLEHLAAPRFLGVSFSVFLLNIYFSLFGFLGAFLCEQLFYHGAAASYVYNFFQTLTVYDVLISIIKSICFGMIISLIAIIQGFSVEYAYTEIPVAGLKAVASCFIWCIAVDIILSVFYYIWLL
ncbi:MAG: ABC transporter permease [Spirochaetaceae bacterium]|nr:ABC transporter permease [Spirochaetaceae bacterium]